MEYRDRGSFSPSVLGPFADGPLLCASSFLLGSESTRWNSRFVPVCTNGLGQQSTPVDEQHFILRIELYGAAQRLSN